MKNLSLALTALGVAATLALALGALPGNRDVGTQSAGAEVPSRPTVQGRAWRAASPLPSPGRAGPAAPVAPGGRRAPPAKREQAERDDPALAAFHEASVTSDDPSVRRSAVRALSRIGGHGARLLLARAYEDPRATTQERLEIRNALADTRRNRGWSSAGIPSGPGLGR